MTKLRFKIHPSCASFIKVIRNGGTIYYYGRRLFGRELISRALHDLVHPAILASERRQNPAAGTVTQEEWDRWLLTALRSDTTEESFRKTRTNVQRNLQCAGVLDITGAGIRTTHMKRARPEAVAFCWLVGHELTQKGQSEIPVDTLMLHSFAHALFFPTLTYVQGCIEKGLSAGVMKREYRAGSPWLVFPSVTHRVQGGSIGSSL